MIGIKSEIKRKQKVDIKDQILKQKINTIRIKVQKMILKSKQKLKRGLNRKWIQKLRINGYKSQNRKD